MNIKTSLNVKSTQNWIQQFIFLIKFKNTIFLHTFLMFYYNHNFIILIEKVIKVVIRKWKRKKLIKTKMLLIHFLTLTFERERRKKSKKKKIRVCVHFSFKPSAKKCWFIQTVICDLIQLCKSIFSIFL